MARREAEVEKVPRSPWPVLLAAIAAYLALLLFRFRSVPDGLVNDAAEEAIRGLRLLEEGRVEVMTFTLGNSAETLWLYLVGLSAKLLGPTVLAVVLPSILAAAAALLLTTLLVLRLAPGVPLFVPLLLGAGSPWLFHYGRSGFRAIAAPLFFAGSALALAHAQSRPERRAPFVAAGAVVGLSLYAYTACRLLPIALVLAFGAVLLRSGAERLTWMRAALLSLAGLAAASLPNLIFLARHPADFLSRGGYVLFGSAADRAGNALATALLPLAYPDRYRALAGPTHFFDGASAGMTSAGIDPVGPVTGVLFVIGLFVAFRRARNLVTAYLAATLLAALVLLGPAGPSLTRLLVVLPALVVFASLGAAALATTRAPRLAAAAVLLAASAHGIAGYFSRVGDERFASRAHAAVAATAMGERARDLSASGPVLCVVSANANVVRYLAHARPVAVVEFYDRPFDSREVPDAPRVLVERVPEFESFRPAGLLLETGADPRFREWTERR